MEFERAAALRDRIRALTNVQANQGINPEGVEEADVVALHQEGGQACVQVFFIRAHQNWGNRAYFPRTGSGAEPGEILEAFLGQFYGNKTPPRLILASHEPDNADLLAEALTAQLGRKVAIARAAARREGGARRAGGAQRPRGAGAADGRERQPDGAARGAGRGLRARRARRSGSRSTTTATSWARTRSAAMIVAGPEGFVKSQYRKFNIRADRPRRRATTSA